MSSSARVLSRRTSEGQRPSWPTVPIPEMGKGRVPVCKKHLASGGRPMTTTASDLTLNTPGLTACLSLKLNSLSRKNPGLIRGCREWTWCHCVDADSERGGVLIRARLCSHSHSRRACRVMPLSLPPQSMCDSVGPSRTVGGVWGRGLSILQQAAATPWPPWPTWLPQRVAADTAQHQQQGPLWHTHRRRAGCPGQTAYSRKQFPVLLHIHLVPKEDNFSSCKMFL